MKPFKCLYCDREFDYEDKPGEITVAFICQECFDRKHSNLKAEAEKNDNTLYG